MIKSKLIFCIIPLASISLLAACSPPSSELSAQLNPVDGAAGSSEEIAEVSATPPETVWRLFRGDSRATGVAEDQLPDQLSLLWKFEVEDGAFEGTAVIEDGIVYIADLDGKVYALDISNGDKKWEFETDSGFTASAALQDGRVFVGDFDGRLYCIDAESGDQIWRFEAEGASFDASANFYDQHVLVGSQDATLYCLEAASGELVWKHEINDQIRCSPTVVDDRTFVAGCDARLHIIDLSSGDEIAGVDIDNPTMVTPAVLGDHVFFGTEGGLFYCVNWKDATVKWTYDDEGRAQSLRSSPAVTDQSIVFGGRSKRIYALDPQTGEQIWTFTTKGGVDSSPVVVGDRVFVGSGDGRVYGLNLADGKESWQYEAAGGFTSSPAVAEGKLVIASDRGVVYCFGEKR